LFIKAGIFAYWQPNFKNPIKGIFALDKKLGMPNLKTREKMGYQRTKGRREAL
jgi:hypothetical protein